MWDLFMYAAIGICVLVLYRGINGKSIVPNLGGSKKKAKTNDHSSEVAVRKIEGEYQDLLNIKALHNNLIELKTSSKDLRSFVGAVACEPINYALRSYEEQKQTDESYEHLLASLSLGPGREVNIATHIHSRPIELTDQLKQYHETFPSLDPIAQRYAQTMFFPFMEQWQSQVEEYDYARYFLVILDYNDKLLGDLDEESILLKVRNEFGRLASSIMSNYSRMGGISEICDQRMILEALYFATHKKTGSIERFRKLVDSDNPLSPFIGSTYERDSYRYMEEEDEKYDAQAEEMVK
ncbi:hypothetical protein SAMN04487897_13118 [Paenibacillus sp. yr247]|uniref:hypothetical protein n=1 Tax=Paenibacillus sp. yr247 TaxID=1761880 RepID=UPI00087DFDB1|nr:hypothetical protein [Paenibacillus sp. yr247]SDP02091.1 hypothetical protein SAMN04487897_13118 [Paenibacillus sp. yr247]